MSETDEHVAAAKRVGTAIHRAKTVGKKRVTVMVADMELLIEAFSGVAAASQPNPDGVDLANTYLDGMVDLTDAQFDGMPTKAQQSWEEFEQAAADQLLTLPAATHTTLRAGYLGGYGAGWIDRAEFRA